MTSAEILAYRDKVLRGFLPSSKPVDPSNPLIAPPPEATREMQETQLVVMLDIAYHLALLTDRLQTYNPPPPELPERPQHVEKKEKTK